jgi:iron complex outermembrane receptor protein
MALQLVSLRQNSLQSRVAAKLMLAAVAGRTGGTMVKSGSNAILAAVALALGTPLGAGVAHAQAGADSAALEEIVVTARKREERLQDLGSSVSALSSRELDRRADVDLQSFANAAPNVVIDDLQQGPGSPAAIAIRGVGSTDVEKSFDPTVGVVVDGIFIGQASGSMLKALDMQGIEILRGPQGTLFGRNSIAGAINLTRRRPDTEDLGGEVRASYGNYDDLQVDGYLNLAVSNQLAFRLFGAKQEHDGYFFNRTQNRHTGELDYRMISPSVLWRPTDGVELYYRFDKTWQDQDAHVVNNNAQPGQVWCFFYQQCAASVTEPQSGERYEVLQNGGGSDSFFDTDMHTFNARWDVAENDRVEYLFGHFKTKEEVSQDWDATPLTLYHTDRPAKYRQSSHELRWTHGGQDPLTFTVGAYLWDSKYRMDLASYIGFIDFLTGGAVPAGTVVTVPQSVKQRTKSYAGFFEADYRFTDALTLTLGGRYTKDKKRNGVEDPAFAAQLAVKGSFADPFRKSWSEFTPKVGLRFRVNEDLMVYGLYTRGFRAGGFSGRANTYEAMSTPYDTEKVDNFELGMKSEWLDRRLRLNASVYLMKYKNKQEELSVPIATGTGQQTLVLNSSKADIKGAELELVAVPAPGLTVAGSLGLLDAKYKDFLDPVTGRDLTFLELRRAPKLTATLSPTYEWAVGEGTLSVSANWHHKSKVYLSFLNTPQSTNGSSDVVDANISYDWKNTTVSVFGLNLTKEDTYSVGFDVGTSLDFAGLWTYTATRTPRLYGVRLRQRF